MDVARPAPAVTTRPGSIGQLGRESIAYALGGALSRAVNLVLLPVYTAAISPREYGVLGTLLVVAAFLAPVATMGTGVSTGIAYYDRTDEAARTRVIWTTLALTLCPSSVVALVAVLTPDRVSQALFGSPAFAYPATLALLSVAATAVTQPLMLGVQFRRAVSKYVWISTTAAACGGVLGYVFVAVLSRGINGVLEAQLVSQLLLLGLAARETLILGRPRTEGKLAANLLRHGLPLVPSFFFLIALQQGNQFILKDSRGLEDLGVYVIGYNLGVVMSLVVAGFTTAWLPFFLSFSQNPSAGHEQLRRAMTYYFIGFGSLTLLFFAWARPVVGLLAASAFEHAHVVVGYCAAAYFLVGVFSVLLPPLYYARQVWAVTVIQGIGVILAILLQFVLIARFGILGAAIGLTSGFLILCLLLAGWLWVFRERYFPIRYDWPRVLGFGCVLVLGAAVSLPTGPTSPLVAVGWSVTASAAILVCSWAALRSDERRAVAAAMRAVVSR